MAILVDLNQVMISNVMMQLGSHKNAEFDEGMIRHMILNSIRKNRMQFKDEYGELVICCDDKNYWRKKYFPYYKARRKTDRESSEIDWNMLFTILHKIRQELKDYFPYKVIQVESAEADDIIGTICHAYGNSLNFGEKFLILSGDKDYIQLHRYANVSQYDPTRKRYIIHDDPDRFLKEQIIRGDAGDGVPNILSPDNAFVMNIRQKPITAKRLSTWLDDHIPFEGEAERGYIRNKTLIDLEEVPETIKKEILDKYNSDTANDRSQLMGYFMQNRLKNLMETITQF